MSSHQEALAEALKAAGDNREAQIGAHLRFVRDSAGLTREQVAEQAGISTASLWNWETGKKSPKFRDVERLADIYGVQLDELVGRAPVAGRAIFHRALADSLLGITKKGKRADDAVRAALMTPKPFPVAVQFPDGAEWVEPNDAIRRLSELIEHVERIAPNVIQDWRERHLSDR